jgi:mercuric ion binding protein
MKIIKFSFILWGLIFSSQMDSFAQSKNIKTDTLTIRGNCGQCKTRIEEAAYVKGVKQAEWNKKTHVLTVTFVDSKTDLTKIAEAIAKAGHDSRLKIADDKNYKKLPGCCAYRTGVCDHD